MVRCARRRGRRRSSCQRFAPPLVFDTLDVTGLATVFPMAAARAPWRSERYEGLVAAQGNWWRWAEYALSVPPMLLIIAALNGMAEESGLFQGAILGAVTQGFGYVADTLAHDEARRRDALAAHALGYIPMTAAFAPVIRGVHVLLTDDTVEPPSFVLFIASQSLPFLSLLVQLWYPRMDAGTAMVFCESACCCRWWPGHAGGQHPGLRVSDAWRRVVSGTSIVCTRFISMTSATMSSMTRRASSWHRSCSAHVTGSSSMRSATTRARFICGALGMPACWGGWAPAVRAFFFMCESLAPRATARAPKQRPLAQMLARADGQRHGR